jgi:hypothetical protein
MHEKSSNRRPWGYFAGGMVATLLVIALFGFFGVLGGACAVRPCTPTGPTSGPCTVNATVFTSGSVCRAPGSACGFVGTCRTRIGFFSGVPFCSCSVI